MDADSLTSTEGGSPTVYRQNVVLADPTAYAAKAGVTNTQPAGTEYGGLVRPVSQPPDSNSSSANLTTAVAGNSFAVTGYPGVSVNVTGSAATFAFKAQCSTDGGTTWTDTYLQTTAGVTASSFAVNGQYAIELLGGTSHVRISVTAIASGTFTYQYRASAAFDSDPTFASPTGSAVPPIAAMMGTSDGSNLQAVRSMTTQPVGTESAVLIRPVSSFPDVTVASTALGALNATIPIALSGQVGASVQQQASGAGGLQGTIVPEISFDGGTTWFSSFFDLPGTSQVVSSLTCTANQAATAMTIVPASGASHARVRVSAYTAGTTNFVARASQILDTTDEDAGPPGTLMPPTVAAHGAKDPGGLLQALQTTTTYPVSTDQGLIVRPASGAPDLSSTPANFTTAPSTGTNFAIAGYPGAGVNVTGSAATFNFKAQFSVDGGTTWIDTYLQSKDGVTATTFAVNGQYAILVPNGTSHVRTVLNAITSGTFTYSYRASQAINQGFIFGTGRTAFPPAVADGVIATALFDKFGRQATTNFQPDQLSGAQINPTTAATTQVLAAGGAGVRYGIVHIHVSNAGSTNQQVDIKDGSTVVWTAYAAASGGGAEADYSNAPILCTAATALNATTSAASSTFIRVDAAQLA